MDISQFTTPDEVFTDFYEVLLRKIVSRLEPEDRIIFYRRIPAGKQGGKDSYIALGTYEVGDDKELWDAEFRANLHHFREQHKKSCNHVRCRYKGNHKWCVTLPPRFSEEPGGNRTAKTMFAEYIQGWIPHLEELAKDPEKLKSVIIELSSVLIQKQG